MAIATLDALLAGMQPPVELFKEATPTLTVGLPQSLFYLAGIPGAAVASAAGMTGEALTNCAGQIPFATPGSGQSAYLARLSATATVAGQLWLCDRLWQNSGINTASTATQTIDSVAWPARDAGGTTDGVGVLIGAEVTAVSSTPKPTMTLTYTNAAGVSGRVSTNVPPTIASAPVGSFFPFGRQAGDKGIRSIQSFKFSVSWGSATGISLVAYRVLARLDLPVAGAGNSIDAVTGGLPKLPSSCVPFLVFVPAATTASTVQGHLVMSHG